MNAAGQLLGERRFAHNGPGVAAMTLWIAETAEAAAADFAVGIEVPYGPVVETLLERGLSGHAGAEQTFVEALPAPLDDRVTGRRADFVFEDPRQRVAGKAVDVVQIRQRADPSNQTDGQVCIRLL